MTDLKARCSAVSTVILKTARHILSFNHNRRELQLNEGKEGENSDVQAGIRPGGATAVFALTQNALAVELRINMQVFEGLPSFQARLILNDNETEEQAILKTDPSHDLGDILDELANLVTTP